MGWWRSSSTTFSEKSPSSSFSFKFLSRIRLHFGQFSMPLKQPLWYTAYASSPHSATNIAATANHRRVKLEREDDRVLLADLADEPLRLTQLRLTLLLFPYHAVLRDVLVDGRHHSL